MHWKGCCSAKRGRGRWLLAVLVLPPAIGSQAATVYSGNDSAGAGFIDNTSDSLIFNDQSTAGSVTIHNDVAGLVQFNDDSTASGATITNIDDSVTEFNDQSSAGRATLVNELDGSVVFRGDSTAGEATILSKNGGYAEFYDNSTAANARLVIEAGGSVAFYGMGAVSAGSIEGNGSLSLGSTTFSVGSNNLSTVFTGSVSGDYTGGLIKLGTGTLTLSGSSTYDGFTLVSAGGLLANGTILSSVTVASGALLGGTGSVGGVQVNAGGILAPGNSIGTLTIDGDLTFASGSVYQVEVDAAGNSDLLIVTGLVSLAGTLQVLAQSGEYSPGTTYNILANDSLSGQFDAVTSDLVFLDFSPSYTATGVQVTVQRNNISFADPALTPNQQAFASGANGLPVDNEVYRTLINLRQGEVADAYNRLSGDAHASVSTALVLDDLGVPWMPLENLNANLANPERALPFWVQLQSGHQRTRDDGNAGLVVLDHDGLLMGSDWPIWGGWRMGVALGYGDQQLGISSRGADADAGTYRSATYVGNQFPLAPGVLKFSSGITYSRHQIDGRRSLRLVDGPERLTSRYDMGIAQGFSELSLRIGDEQQDYVEPFARLVSLDQRVEGFDERGGSAALSAASQATQVLSSTLGARGQYKTQLLGRELVLKGSLALRQLQGDLRPELELRLDQGEPFKVLGTRLPSNSVLLDLHADYALAPGIGLDIRYKGMSGSGSEGNALAASLRWRF